MAKPAPRPVPVPQKRRFRLTGRTVLRIGVLSLIGASGLLAGLDMFAPPTAEIPASEGAALPATATPLGRLATWSRPALGTRIDQPEYAEASSGNPISAVDGKLKSAWEPRPKQPGWLSLQLADHHGPRLLLVWQAFGHHYLYRRTIPKTYRLLASDDSPDGIGGMWRVLETVTENRVRTRGHVVTAPGAKWLRLQIDGSWTGTPSLTEIVVYDLKGEGPAGCFLVLGDGISNASLTQFTWEPARESADPQPVPLFINGGANGLTAGQGLKLLGQALAVTPPQTYIGIALGSTDALTGTPLPQFERQLQQMVDAIRLSGHLPLLARPPWNPQIKDYLAVIDHVATANGLPAGPDLYGWFQTHSADLGMDGFHPTPAGQAAIRRLWHFSVLKTMKGKP
ncbi:MAG: hypothetical protein H7338_22820 [Candidatus Sericytochromatia bacterium]|nr:hypothetical protein [Candidatus Sericytochromatia bacterium]